MTIIKPINEKRLFDAETLSNNIKCAYCQDIELDKTIVNVCVKIGSIADPEEYQGLAHFLEHLLFMGSKKYPDQSHYDKTLKKHGGDSNAYTDLFETVYFFSVYNNGLEDVLDVFSRFFIDPLFNKDNVIREMNAINSEHEKNINNQRWHEMQLLRNLAKKDNDYNTFGTGNFKSLNKPDVHEQMIKFWEDYYTTNNLSVSIVSNIDINKQKEIIKKTFGNIIKRETKEYKLIKPIFNRKNQTIQLIPIIDKKTIKYYWEIPAFDQISNYTIYNSFGELLTTKQKGSLFDSLKIDGLITNIYYNIHNEGIFEINISLTDEGLERIIDVIGKFLFSVDYIINKYDLKTAAKYYQKLNKLNFELKGKDSPEVIGETLAINLHYYSKENLIAGNNITSKIDYNDINYLKSIINNYFVILVKDSKLNNPITDNNYGFKYQIIDNFKSDKISFGLDIDLTNDFLDIKPTVINNLGCDEKPTLIKQKIWYGGCSKFNEPYINAALMFNNEKFFNSPINFIMTTVAINCLNLYLIQKLYNILSLNIGVVLSSNTTTNMVILYINSLNDPIKFNKLFNLIINLLKFPEIPDKVIQTNLESIRKSLKNIEKETPLEYLSINLNHLIYSNQYEPKELIKAINNLKINDIRKYINTLFENTSLKSFYYGNLNIDYIPNHDFLTKLYFNDESNFSTITFPKSLHIKHPNKDEMNSAVIIYYPIGDFNPLIFIKGMIIQMILEQPFFEEIRTNKQLGYLAYLGLGNRSAKYFLVQKVQSKRKPDEIINHIDDFNINIKKYIKEANLDEWKLSAKNHLEEKPTSNREIFEQILSEIEFKTFLFNRNKLVVNQLDNITKESLIEFVDKFINNENRCIYTIK